MALIKDGIYTADDYDVLTDISDLNAGVSVAVDLETWQENRAALIAHDGKIALMVGNDLDVREIAEDLEHLSAVFVDFPVFSDGRGFSQARQLRETHGYQGEIRARGHIIRDQYLFLHRCGVNAIEVNETRALADWNAAMQEFSLFYQRTQDRQTTIARLRTENIKLAS